MKDFKGPKVKRYNMTKVPTKNTAPELIVRKYLFAKGLRYRIHDNRLPGKPDVVLPKYRAVVFVHGCFWHGHDGCKLATIPQTDPVWWQNKVDKNKERDAVVGQAITQQGWRVLVVYACELKPKFKEATLERLYQTITQPGETSSRFDWSGEPEAQF